MIPSLASFPGTLTFWAMRLSMGLSLILSFIWQWLVFLSVEGDVRMSAQQILIPAAQILGSWAGNFIILSFPPQQQDIKPLNWHGTWLPAKGIFGERMDQLLFLLPSMSPWGGFWGDVFPRRTNPFGIEKAGKRVFLLRAVNKKQAADGDILLVKGWGSECRQMHLFLCL